jgi:hypothetical protein
MDLKTRFYLLLISLTVCIQPLQAAELAGRVWFENTKRPASGVRIVITCGQVMLQSRSDQYGFYRRPEVPPKASCVIVLDDGQRYSEPLKFYSGQGRDTQNFGVRVQNNRLIVRKY